MSLTDSMSLSDIAAVTKDSDGFGGNGAWWLIVLFLFVFMGNGFGGWNGAGANNNYVLTSDFSQLSRQMDSGFDGLRQQSTSIANGICSLGYDQLAQMNGINTNILTNSNTLQSAINNCCCNTRESISNLNYNMATNTNTLQNAIQTGFCQTNYNNQNNTRDIIDAGNANTKSILDFLVKDKIESLQQENNALRLSASQQMQNAYLISQLKTTTGTTGA